MPEARVVGAGAACAEALSEAEPALRDAIGRRPDLLVEAVRRDVPILLAGPQALFGDWLTFSGGLAIRLDCSRAGLDRWWASLATGLSFRPRARTACERFK